MKRTIQIISLSILLCSLLAGAAYCADYPPEYCGGNVVQVSKELKAHPKLINKWLGAKKDRGTLLGCAVNQDNVAMAKMLLSCKGVDVMDAGDECGFTPLHFATSVDMAKLLLSKGADINRPHVGGRTPLHAAIWLDHRDVAKYLIQYGADVNAACDHGTCLQLAADWGKSAEVVKALLVNGADPSVKGNMEQTPLELAEDRKDKDSPSTKAIIDLLKAVAGGANPASITVADPGLTPQEFLDGAKYGNADMVARALKADPSLAKAADENGATALHYAAAAGSTDVTRLLLAGKADVNAKKKDGVTPLHVAAALGKTDVVKTLLAAGANPNAKDAKGRTPVSLARAKGFRSITALLRKGGATKAAPAARVSSRTQGGPQSGRQPRAGDARSENKPDGQGRFEAIEISLPQEKADEWHCWMTASGDAYITSTSNPCSTVYRVSRDGRSIPVRLPSGAVYWSANTSGDLLLSRAEQDQSTSFLLMSGQTGEKRLFSLQASYGKPSSAVINNSRTVVLTTKAGDSYKLVVWSPKSPVSEVTGVKGPLGVTAINDRGCAAGWGSGAMGFVWSQERGLRDIEKKADIADLSINAVDAAGIAYGMAQVTDGKGYWVVPCSFDSATMSWGNYARPQGWYTYANANGDAVGVLHEETRKAFLQRKGAEKVDLAQLIDGPAVPGLSNAVAINDRGVILAAVEKTVKKDNVQSFVTDRLFMLIPKPLHVATASGKTDAARALPAAGAKLADDPETAAKTLAKYPGIRQGYQSIVKGIEAKNVAAATSVWASNFIWDVELCNGETHKCKIVQLPRKRALEELEKWFPGNDGAPYWRFWVRKVQPSDQDRKVTVVAYLPYVVALEPKNPSEAGQATGAYAVEDVWTKNPKTGKWALSTQKARFFDEVKLPNWKTLPKGSEISPSDPLLSAGTAR